MFLHVRSKHRNECHKLSGMYLNHSITELLFFYWFRPVAATTLVLILGRSFCAVVVETGLVTQTSIFPSKFRF